MYIGGTGKDGYHHLLWEIVDNSIDEVINKHATRVEVTLHKDGKSATVEDNGRGIPVDTMPKLKKSALEVIFTTLHSGGKFERGKSYAVSGGLHGVGASVVNALSSELIATVKRDGERYEMSVRARRADGQAEEARRRARHRHDGARSSPTTRSSAASCTFDPELIAERLEAKSYLHGGLEIVFTDETQVAAGRRTTFVHPQGIAEYLPKLVAERGKPPVPPSGARVLHGEARRGGAARLELALQWTEATDDYIKTYVNSVPTPDGGTHDAGLRAAIVKAIRNYIATHKLDPKGVTLTAEDIREGVVAVLSTYVHDPQFQSQTKNRLNNPEVAGQVEALVRPALENYLNSNPNWAQAVVARTIIAARAREASRAAHQAVHAQDGGQPPAEPAGQARRLRVDRSGRERAVHRRGRLGRRLREAGPRSQDAGDPAAARQGAQRRAGEQPEAAREQGAPGHRVARSAAAWATTLDRRQAALRQDLPADGRRRRRPPHRDAAADVLLPPHAAADRRAATSTSRSRRSTGSTSASRRTGRSTTSTRSGCSSSTPRATRSRASRGSRASAR